MASDSIVERLHRQDYELTEVIVDREDATEVLQMMAVLPNNVITLRLACGEPEPELCQALSAYLLNSRPLRTLIVVYCHERENSLHYVVGEALIKNRTLRDVTVFNLAPPLRPKLAGIDLFSIAAKYWHPPGSVWRVHHPSLGNTYESLITEPSRYRIVKTPPCAALERCKERILRQDPTTTTVRLTPHLGDLDDKINFVQFLGCTINRVEVLEIVSDRHGYRSLLFERALGALPSKIRVVRIKQ